MEGRVVFIEMIAALGGASVKKAKSCLIQVRHEHLLIPVIASCFRPLLVSFSSMAKYASVVTDSGFEPKLPNNRAPRLFRS